MVRAAGDRRGVRQSAAVEDQVMQQGQLAVIKARRDALDPLTLRGLQLGPQLLVLFVQVQHVRVVLHVMVDAERLAEVDDRLQLGRRPPAAGPAPPGSPTARRCLIRSLRRSQSAPSSRSFRRCSVAGHLPGGLLACRRRPLGPGSNPPTRPPTPSTHRRAERTGSPRQRPARRRHASRRIAPCRKPSTNQIVIVRDRQPKRCSVCFSAAGPFTSAAGRLPPFTSRPA